MSEDKMPTPEEVLDAVMKTYPTSELANRSARDLAVMLLMNAPGRSITLPLDDNADDAGEWVLDIEYGEANGGYLKLSMLNAFIDKRAAAVKKIYDMATQCDHPECQQARAEKEGH